MAVDTLFTISTVRDEKTKSLQYYEITPSPIFLDQRESYFMLVPYNWREEVRKLVGQRKASSYTFRFLIFLRYQFELRRRSPPEKKPYSIKWSSDEIAIALKMPESVYRRKKARANKILEDVYSTAKQLGDLSDFERTDTVDILWLNEIKYYSPNNLENLLPNSADEGNEMEEAKKLHAFFIEEKRKLDPRYNPPAGGPIHRSSLKHLIALLNSRSLEEIQEVIKWGLSRPYWTSRIGIPSKLRKYFSEAFTEMKASKHNPAKDNATVAREIAKKFPQTSSGKPYVEALTKYLEVGNGVHQPSCVEYSSKKFQEELENALRKWGIRE